MAQDLTGLNTLRQALTPYEDVKFELNLNRHPKAHKNKSLVYAENMKLSNDGAVLENEESIKINDYINNVLTDYYKEFKIIHIIPCNTELVLFVKGSENNNFQIWRYREKTSNYIENISIFYNKEIPYNGGSFSGTFTYTSNDSLIIAFCEYPENNNQDFMSPMMTINLGTFTKGYTNESNANHLKCRWESTIGEFNDRDLETYKLPICPEVRLPQISNIRNVKGNSYIGTYYVYIRYKINKYDYTQWFNIGYPIINEFKQDTILHEKVTTNKVNKEDGDYEDLIGANPTSKIKKLSTYVNQDKDLINSCINININHITPVLYEYCQIGFMCISNTYTKYFITNDILLSDKINISIDSDNLKEEIFNTNIYENYYNVKNIINKNNKLYISNYLTTNDKNINVDDVTLSLKKGVSVTNGVKNSSIIEINNIVFNKDDLNYKTFGVVNVITDEQSGDKDNPYLYNKINISYISLPLFLKLNNLDKYLTKIVRVYYNKGDGMESVDIASKDFKVGFNRTTVSNGVDILGGVKLNIFSFYQPAVNINVVNYKQGINFSSGNPILQYNNCYFFCVDDNDKSKDKYRFDISAGLTITDGVNHDIEYHKLNTLDNFNETYNYNVYDYLYNNEYYYNSLNNLTNNNVLTSLCKGEIYDFYIHFIDKYGHITDGYKLKNKDKRFEGYFNYPIDENTIKETRFELCFYKTKNGSVIAIPATLKAFYVDDDKNWIPNIHDWNVKLLIGTKQLILNTIKGEHIVDEYVTNLENNTYYIDEIKNCLNNINYLQVDDFENLTFGDIFDIQPPVAVDNAHPWRKDLVKFIPYYNSQNDLFFKVPKLYSKENDTQLGLNIHINDIKNYGDYVSYFISFKKLEKTYCLYGIGNQNQLNNIILNDNFKSGNIIKKYSIYKKNWDTNVHKCTLQEDIMHSNNFICYPNLLNKLAYAENAQLNRSQRQTTLYLSDVIVDIKGDVLQEDENIDELIYSVNYLEMINLNKDKYINNNVLYRIGNILINNNEIILDGLNGKYDNELVIKYGARDNGVVNLVSSSGEGSYGEVYLYELFGFYEKDYDGIYLSKSSYSHKIPKKEYDGVNKVYKVTGVIGTDIFYRVIDTLNLFNYKISNVYNTWINFYNKFNPNNDYLNEFNRTIYRSQVISDEGRTNNWRWFENDAYKNIEENKGNITNILSIGNYLYVHTEHSLYAFSEDNTLSMNNQNLQVATPDIFETEYKEVFISSLGYGGLQDKDAWISGQFGYIWFNNDTKQILKVYGNSMDIISNDIKEWLENCNILNVRFANDIKNNRILMNIKIQMIYYNQNVEKDIILSYNILSKTFISLHDYSFNNTYNTKNNLYFLNNNINITKFIEDDYGTNINKEKQYKVYFIINKYYNTIKYLENIVYKLRKRTIKNDASMLMFADIEDFINFPVEQKLLPYSGKNIRIFNDLVDTGWLDCNTSNNGELPNNEIKDFEKPYWDLGNWNFNFLRDSNHDNSNSRLYGNYFIIAFDFGNAEKLIEFESLDTNLTQDKNL